MSVWKNVRMKLTGRWRSLQDVCRVVAALQERRGGLQSDARLSHHCAQLVPRDARRASGRDERHFRWAPCELRENHAAWSWQYRWVPEWPAQFLLLLSERLQIWNMPLSTILLAHSVNKQDFSRSFCHFLHKGLSMSDGPAWVALRR